MMTTVLLALAAGFCAGNGLPYYNLGSTGGLNPTPFGESAVVNVVVGWVMFVVAAICWQFADVAAHPMPGYAAAAAGVLVVGLIHARNWRNNPWRGRRGLLRGGGEAS
ncbi:hypothetical protein [Pseudonocardia adelaidensis]|uniref:Integral membrane protein n=1 Tax=Pseudonocardia adelaidensis TaxID=648754 RepID=A0ABP9NMT0_9PSEU